MESKGLIFNEGQLIDASFTVAPRQRNTREENEKIKNGEVDDCGMTNHTRSVTKIQIPVGRRKTMKHFMAIKTS